MCRLFVGHFRNLVQQNDVAELDLFDNKILDVFFVDIAFCERVSAVEFVEKSEGVDNSHYAVELGQRTVVIFRYKTGYRIDCLRNRFGFAYSAGFYDYIVEIACGNELAELFDEVHFQCAADAAVLKCDEVLLIFLSYYTFFSYQRRVDIHFSDVVHDYGKADAAFIGKYAVQ